MKHVDVIILGAGGAGLFCASKAAYRGRSVLVLDHGKKLGSKILISGGGRCNFTNLGATPNNYVSNNPHFCKSAFARFSPWDFIELIDKYGIKYHEKKLGQQFCDGSAQQIVDLLKSECDESGADILLDCQIKKVSKIEDARINETPDPAARFHVDTSQGHFTCESLVIATGGLSIPKIGATGFGYTIAKQFGLKLIPTRAALDGFTLNSDDAKNFGDLSGLAVDTITSVNDKSFRENILFTHAGLSGPATLQASLHWNPGDPVHFNLVPETDALDWFLTKKKSGSKTLVKNLLAELIPSRLADRFLEIYFEPTSPMHTMPLVQVPDQPIKDLCARLHDWVIVPAGTVGYNKAEVTRGGVDTDELSSKTMEAKKIPGLYFIGEVVDVTGWLGGYNFQWAWASGAACGSAV
jgi:predicted Rossmann fold flavoprotein